MSGRDDDEGAQAAAGAAEVFDLPAISDTGPAVPPARVGRPRWPPVAILAATIGGGAAIVILLPMLAGLAYVAQTAALAVPPAGARVGLKLPRNLRVGRSGTLRLVVSNAGPTPVAATELFVDGELLDHLDGVVVRPSRGSAAPLLALLRGRTYRLDTAIAPGKSLSIDVDFKPRTPGALSGLVALTLDGRSVGRPVILPVAVEPARRPGDRLTSPRPDGGRPASSPR